MQVLHFGNKLDKEVCCGFIFTNLLTHYISWLGYDETFQDLVAKVKNLVTLAPVLGAISHPVLCWFSDTFLFPWTPGIIKAIQLDYSEAHKNLLQAIRKAPQQAAIGFKQTVSRLNQWQTIFFLFFNMVIIITIELLIETYFMVWKWRQMLYWDLQLLSDKTIETLRTAHWCLQLPSVVILYLLKSLVANFVSI